MRAHITNYVKNCPLCQRNKRRQKKYGLLPPKLAEATPWDKLCVDLIGPYKIRRKGSKDLICRCVTMIDSATRWFEIQQYNDKQSITVANRIEQEWFSRYPWPTQVTFNRGSEFIGQDFQKMIKEYYGVKAKPSTVRNPQANAIVEWVHQAIGNIICTFELKNNYLDDNDPWKGILSWEYICARKQNIIVKNNKAENAKIIPHTYNIGDKVLLKRGTKNKYETPYQGPFTITQVNENGTVQMMIKNVEDTINITRLTPYLGTDNIPHGGECSMWNSRVRRANQD
jgi:hypothetical protein